MSKPITSARLATVTAGFQTTFNKAQQEAPSQWARIAMRTTSNSAKEIYGWLQNNFGMKELIGEIEIEGLETLDYELANKEFHDTKAVKQADIERDNEGIYAPMFQMMGMGANRAYDILVFKRLLEGFTNVCYTGKTFFNTAHPTGKKGVTFSNKGTKKWSAANFEAARTFLQTVPTANGDPWGFGTKLLVICSPQYQSQVHHVLKDDKTTGGESNPYKDTAEYLVSPYLQTNPDAWFLLEVGWPVLPILLQEEKKITIASANKPDDSYVILNHQFLFQAYGRYNAGYGLPQMAYGSTGADAA
jgi:phage major head subunit gpT-like protein